MEEATCFMFASLERQPTVIGRRTSAEETVVPSIHTEEPISISAAVIVVFALVLVEPSTYLLLLIVLNIET